MGPQEASGTYIPTCRGGTLAERQVPQLSHTGTVLSMYGATARPVATRRDPGPKRPFVHQVSRLSPTSLARYQSYLSKAEDSTSSAEEVVRTRSGRTLRMRPTRCRLQERPRKKRHVLQSMARPLKKWLIRHRNKPYPSKAEKLALAMGSHMTLEQVSNWFANARRRLKNTVFQPGVNWGDRIRQYNSYITGNSEPLSISSDDSIWDSDCEPDPYRMPDNSSEQLCESSKTGMAELCEHSYSSTAVEPRVDAWDRRVTPAKLVSLKRSRQEEPDSEPDSKRFCTPSYDSDSPSEDESSTTGPTVEPVNATRVQAGSKRRYEEDAESSHQCKKYKTKMLLRYIGADTEHKREQPKTHVKASKRHKGHAEVTVKVLLKNGSEGKGQRTNKKRKRPLKQETISGSELRLTEMEAAEALTRLSQSTASRSWHQEQSA